MLLVLDNNISEHGSNLDAFAHGRIKLAIIMASKEEHCKLPTVRGYSPWLDCGGPGLMSRAEYLGKGN